MVVLKHIIVIVVFLAMMPLLTHAVELKEGERLPLFTLMNEDGKMVKLESILDRPTIIYFTHNACHYCTQIIPMLEEAEKEFGRERVRVIGVNVMARDQRLIRAYKEELGFTFPMFAGNRADVLKTFKIQYVPKLLFIDKQKIVRKEVGHYIHKPELYENIREIINQ